MRYVLMFVPFLLGLVAWLPFVALLRQGRRGAAAAVVGTWAVLLMGGLPLLELQAPGICSRMFPGAGRYEASMLSWAVTGVGCESDPTCFLPQHLLHAGIFAAATLATGGLLGLVFAAVLFGWMGAYGGGLAAISASPGLAALASWHPWAVIRVAAFLALGVALAEPLVRVGLPPGRPRFPWLAAGLAGLLADVIVKAVLASAWWRLVIHPLLQP